MVDADAVRPRTRPKSIRDNRDGTVTVRDGDREETMPAPDAIKLYGADGARDPRKLGKGLSDCAWCRYGKPALAGAVAGAAVAAVAGYEPTRGLVWGGVGGLLYGQLRG